MSLEQHRVLIGFEATDEPLADAAAELLVVGAFAGGDDAPPRPGPAAAGLAAAAGIELDDELAGLSFRAELGAAARVPTRGALAAPMILLVGLGAPDELTPSRLCRAAAAAGQASERTVRLATGLHADAERLDSGEAAAAVAEGIALAAYRFAELKTDPTPHELEHVTVHGGDRTAVEEALAAAEPTIEAVWLARDLVNLPPGRKRPPALAVRAREELADLPVAVEILDENDLEQGGYGGLLGVGAGSSSPPRLVQLDYRPAGATGHIALVAKGITFDSGGLSLKSSKSMEWMKVDMGGAAAVLGAVRVAAMRGLPLAITGLLALAENMPGGSATRPGDVLTSYGGSTIEVLNTDAEGRLVLADALGRASELGPDAIVDVATLTGAAVVALGPKIGALMSTDDALADGLLAAARATGEPLWRLPLAVDEYGEDLQGEVGDVKNSGWKGAGAVRAGLFLHHFVDDAIPWAHLDIAGVAWAEETDGLLRAGGTGVPVRTLVRWLQDGPAAGAGSDGRGGA